MRQSYRCEQVDRYRNINLPIFFSEYGYDRQPRNFNETTALFSSQMTEVFSGGCVYEFWQGGNCYGLVKIPSSRDSAVGRVIPSHHTRDTELGQLLIFDDFENYKNKLRAIQSIEVNTQQHTPLENDSANVAEAARLRFERDGQIPESCVNWNRLGA